MIKPPPLLPSAINKASATGENPCVHQSSMGGRSAANGGSRRMEAEVQMPVLTSRNSKRRLPG